jgi:predicted anti-sigma-YlaC factor YlaD
VTTAGCSIKRLAVNKLGNALASGGSTYESDNDPDLVGDALPFGLKLIESLLAESPKHRGLLLAAASGFTEYSYAFVDQRADEAASESLERSKALRARACRLYLRAHAYGLRGLELHYPGIGAALDREPTEVLARVRKQDLPLLYWTAASLGLAISTSKDQPEMIARLPAVEAMIHRVWEVDENWGDGSVPEFLISVESARTGVRVDQKQDRMYQYFERALKLSKGERASTYISYAENACVPAQNRAEFQSLLERALEIDPDGHPESRLANLVAQHRARWLLGRIDELFLDPAPAKP